MLFDRACREENDEEIERECKRRASWEKGDRDAERDVSSPSEGTITDDLRMQAIPYCVCAIIGTPCVFVINGGICPERC